MTHTGERVERNLFADPTLQVYAILDGASVPDLLPLLEQFKPQWECLYRGELDPDLAEAAPYLVRLDAGHGFTQHVLGYGWGRHWGVFVLVTNIAMADLHRHFRRFLIVHDEAGEPLYFRYYDPRVLRTYLPTCNAEELGTVFGPVRSYAMEDESGAAVSRFSLSGKELVHAVQPIDQ